MTPDAKATLAALCDLLEEQGEKPLADALRDEGKLRALARWVAMTGFVIPNRVLVVPLSPGEVTYVDLDPHTGAPVRPPKCR